MLLKQINIIYLYVFLRPANIGELSRGPYHLLFPVLTPTPLPLLASFLPFPFHFPIVSYPYPPLAPSLPQISLRGKLPLCLIGSGRQTHYGGTEAKTGHMALG